MLDGRQGAVTAPTESDQALLIRANAASETAIHSPTRALEDATALAEAAHGAGCHEARIVALRVAGWAARELHQHDAAAAYLQEAATVATQRKLPGRLSEVRLVQAMLYLELGDLRTARRHL